MFELGERVAGAYALALADLDTAHLADVASRLGAVLTELINLKLVLAATWADRHPGDLAGSGSMLLERALTPGAEGTPSVAEGAVVELGQLYGLPVGAAQRLIRDALEIRHRLPQLWEEVRVGALPEWQARRVAQATHHLSADAAGQVDHQLAPWAGALGWPRLETLLDAAVIAADPDSAARLAEQAASEVGVWGSRVNPRGQRGIYCRTTAHDAAWFLGLVGRLADLLAADGDTRSADERRAAAFGLLARPADALALLHRHGTEKPGAAMTPGEQVRPEGTPTGDRPAGDAPAAAGDDLFSSLTEPDPAEDENCTAEWVPDPDRPAPVEPFAEPVEPGDDHCTCGARTDDDQSQGRLEMRLPGGFDPAAVRPAVTLHFHLSDIGLAKSGGDALVRPEHHTDPMRFAELLSWLAGIGCPIRIQPVIDPAATAPADAYEIPDRIRAAVRYRHIVEVSPWGVSRSRSLDLDHSRAYDPCGPPGQTAVGNLGPLVRPTHRAKTLGVVRLRQPSPGVYLWRTRHGHVNLVTNRGTLSLGTSAFSHALWEAAAR